VPLYSIFYEFSFMSESFVVRTLCGENIGDDFNEYIMVSHYIIFGNSHVLLWNFWHQRNICVFKEVSVIGILGIRGY